MKRTFDPTTDELPPKRLSPLGKLSVVLIAFILVALAFSVWLVVQVEENGKVETPKIVKAFVHLKAERNKASAAVPRESSHSGNKPKPVVATPSTRVPQSGETQSPLISSAPEVFVPEGAKVASTQKQHSQPETVQAQRQKNFFDFETLETRAFFTGCSDPSFVNVVASEDEGANVFVVPSNTDVFSPFGGTISDVQPTLGEFTIETQEGYTVRIVGLEKSSLEKGDRVRMASLIGFASAHSQIKFFVKNENGKWVRLIIVR